MSSSAYQVVQHIAGYNGISINKTVRVPSEEARDAEQVMHICRAGLSVMFKQSYTINVPASGGRTVERVDCNLWNCPSCGKTYFTVIKDKI